MMTGKIFLVCLLMVYTPRYLYAQHDRSLQALEQRAFSYIVKAQQSITYANALIQLKPDRESAEIFADLYLQAAQLFGDASRLLKAIGPFYVHQNIVDQFAEAERNCLNIVGETRRLINQGEIIRTSDNQVRELMKKIEELQDELPK